MTDVLAARTIEMQSAQGRLARQPNHVAMTLMALLTRTKALRDALAIDPGQPDPLALAITRVREMGEAFAVGYENTWRSLASLVVSLLSVEVKLAALQGQVIDPLASGDLLGKMAGQIALDGLIHRHVEAFYQAIEIMVGRVQSAEVQLRSQAVQTATTKASQAPAATA